MKTKINKSDLKFMILALLGMAIAAGVVIAQDRPIRRPGPQQQPQVTPEETAKEPLGPIIAIVGGRIYTVTHEIIREGTILVQEGKILKVGQDLAVPEGAEVIDAAGRHVAPGFIALNASRIGVTGATGGQNRVQDALNPFDQNMQYLLGVGITTICSSTGAGGQRARGRTPQPTPAAPTGDFSSTDQIVIKMTYGDIEGMYVAENPFFAVRSASFRGGLNAFNWREELKRAKSFIKAQENPPQEGQGGLRGQRPSANQDVVRLLQGEAVLRTDAQTVDQIRDMITFSQNYGYRMILEGVDEAWLIADELGPAGIAAIITPRAMSTPQAGREETTGGTMELAMYLEKVGVPFAINAQSGSLSLGDSSAGRDLQGLPLQAMFAVSGGCSEKSALEALTIVPARMMGLQDRMGSIEAGKDADILIMDGHPLDYKTYVEKALVNGKVYYDRASAQILPVFDRSFYEQRIKIDK